MNGAAGEPQARPLARLTSVTVYPPGEPPLVFGEAEIIAAGVQGPLTVAVVVDPAGGGQIAYYGLPMRVVSAAPSGLVAPAGRL